MTDPTQPEPEDEHLSPAVLDELSSLLGDPSMWEDVDQADEDAIVAAIADLGEREPTTAPSAPVVRETPVTEQPWAARPAQDEALAEVVPISTVRRWAGPIVAGIAAALAMLVGASFFAGDDDRSGVDLALEATELAPGAEGVVEIIDTPNGTVLRLDVSGLAPAPEDTYYEAWLRKDAEVGVSAGTFHLRGGGGEIELWAGVTIEDYPLFTVTIQPEAQVESSGQVVLRGRVGE